MMTTSDVDRLYGKIDEIFTVLADMQKDMAAVNERCPKCQSTLEKHEQSLAAVQTELVVMKATREGVELSMKAIVAAIGVVGSLSGAIAGLVMKYTT